MWTGCSSPSTKALFADGHCDVLPGGTAHALLSSTHTDTTAAAVVRGDVVTGQGTAPVWARLAKGTQYTVFQAGANEPLYDALHLDQSAAVTGILGSANGGVNNAFYHVTGPASSIKDYAFPNANATIAYTVASGTKALSTSALGATTCRDETATATGALSTDAIYTSFNASTTSATGYAAGAGMGVRWFVSADTVTFQVCNNSASPITPDAVSINWRLGR
jgi:hypothetical protein